MKKWFVAHTHPQKESYAKTHLQQQGFEVYLPCVKKIRRHARKVDEVLAPLFPRYMFVNFDLLSDKWGKINNTRGVSYLLTNNLTPTQISNHIIEDLKSREIENSIVPINSLILFCQGDRVRMLDGAFQDTIGTFLSLDGKDRVKILLNFLGRETSVKVPLNGIEKVQEKRLCQR